MCLYVEFAENGSVGSYIEARLGKPEKERAWAWGKEIAEGRTLASICSETYLWPPPLGCKKVVLVGRWSLYRGRFNTYCASIVGT